MEVIFALAFAFFVGAQQKESLTQNIQTDNEQEVIYNPSETRVSDLIHTKLNVRFDWPKRQLIGQAQITAKPYFHPTNQIILDAKGFDINSVTMAGDSLDYKYDQRFLTIELPKTYNRNEIYTLDIDYVAKPYELKTKGSVAISDAKGLYFVNHDGSKDIPQQIWTQGETEASSCWFPTIDSPNEMMTQEIYMTVNNKYTTLSNGLLLSSVDNANGTRTDHWSQKLNHTPYLAMMAVGEFSITSDKWRGIDVDYYLEEDYHPYARQIFGRTPQMLEHFSRLLGVDYPWEKYAQIVVREFVSGAMENTTAVIYGDFVQMTERELIDDHQDDIIAHELFHHWFGDLVTCESWANLPLNESFATYGEYLWREEGFGRMEADQHLDADLRSYLNESRRKQVDMIRFDYEDKEDMFDSHSYAKGGRILHMLRKYLGDDAFFNGLKKYLKDNAYQSVEIHQLRIAMEAVCGEDLNWFFNQWFLSSGHPLLVVDYSYDSINKQQHVILEQIQDLEKTPLYRLPMAIDIYEGKNVVRYKIEMNKKKQTFVFDVDQKVTNVVVDSEHMLLAEIFDDKPIQWWTQQIDGPLYMDAKKALENVSEQDLTKVAEKALSHPYWGIRELAIAKLEQEPKKEAITKKVYDLAQNDKSIKVRAQAVSYLSKIENIDQYYKLFEEFTKERSMAIAEEALLALASIDSKKALLIAQSFEEEMLSCAYEVYSIYAGKEKLPFLQKHLLTSSGYDRYYFSGYYVEYLKKQPFEVLLEGVPSLINIAQEATSWMVWVSERRLEAVKAHLTKEIKKVKDKPQRDKAESLLSMINTQLELLK